MRAAALRRSMREMSSSSDSISSSSSARKTKKEPEVVESEQRIAHVHGTVGVVVTANEGGRRHGVSDPQGKRQPCADAEEEVDFAIFVEVLEVDSKRRVIGGQDLDCETT